MSKKAKTEPDILYFDTKIGKLMIDAALLDEVCSYMYNCGDIADEYDGYDF